MNMLQQIERQGISVGHGNHVCDVRTVIEKHPCMTMCATQMIRDVTGVEIAFEDDNVALATTQYLFDDIIRHRTTDVDVRAQIDVCLNKAKKLVLNPKNNWMYNKVVKPGESSMVKTEVDGVDVQVEVRSNGKIKKGGKAILAQGLMYRYLDECVAQNKPYTPKEMKAVLVKDCQMSELGAGTYEYGLRVTQKLIEKYEQEKGVTIPMQMKGKK